MSPIARSLGWHSRSNVTPYFLHSVPDRAEALDQQFQAAPARTSGMLVPSDLAGQRREEEPVAPAVGRRADEAGQRDLAVLQLATGARRSRTHAIRSLHASLVDQLADFVGHEVRIGARRVVPGLCARPCTPPRLALPLQKLQRLGARLVAERLALQVRGDGEDFQPVLLGQVDALLGVGGGAGVGVALAQVELPASPLPSRRSRRRR